MFTIHVRLVEAPQLTGRVTHAASGAASHFESLAELEWFVRRVLTAGD